MVKKIMEWVSITALVDFVVCGGALVGVLALFFIKHEIETHTFPTPRSESL